MGNLIEALEHHRLVGFDTPIFVYHIEQTSKRVTPAGHMLRALADGKFAGITSVLTLLEIAIKPLRIDRREVADAYELLVQDIDNLAVVGIDARVSRIVPSSGLNTGCGRRTRSRSPLALLMEPPLSSPTIDVYAGSTRSRSSCSTTLWKVKHVVFQWSVRSVDRHVDDLPHAPEYDFP